METTPRAAPGWYPCPVDPDILRYFNGSAWTEETAQPAVPSVAELAAPPPVRQVPSPQVHSQAPVANPPAQVYQPYARPPAEQVQEQHGYAPHGYQPPGYAPLGYAQQGYDPYPGAPQGEPHGPKEALHWIVPVGRSGASIAAGYVGIVALFVWPAGPIAIGMGIWGLRKARSGGHGSGRSVFAIVAGVLSSVLAGLFFTGMLF